MIVRDSVRARALVLVAVAVGLLAAAPALAQPDEASDARARRHFQSGESYYQAGDYENAIREFEMAYGLSRRPELLFNLANSHERLGQLEEAIAKMEQYISEVPSAPNRGTLEERITNMRRRLAQQQSGGTGETGGTGTTTTTTSTGTTSPPSDGGGVSIGGVVLLGVAGVALASGIVFGLMAGSEYGTLETECGPGCSDQQVSTLQTYSLIADLSFGLSLATAIIGGILVLPF